MPATKPAVVMDCGTGYTKMGFAGNVQVRPCPVVAMHGAPCPADARLIYGEPCSPAS